MASGGCVALHVRDLFLARAVRCKDPDFAAVKPGQTVSLAQLDSAVRSTQGELDWTGLWKENGRLLRCEVFWCPWPQITMPGALGFFVHETDRIDRVLRYEVGHIYIPKWVLLHGPWQQRGSLRDVVRHEYGHAIAHYYPGLVQRSPHFRRAFGGGYWDQGSAGGCAGDFVSAYARTSPSEDFAETFMLYLRHRGQLPARFSSAAVKRKWRFVADLAQVVESGRARW